MSETKEPIVERLTCMIGGKMDFRKCNGCPFMRAESADVAPIIIETTATGHSSYRDLLHQEILNEVQNEESTKIRFFWNRDP